MGQHRIRRPHRSRGRRNQWRPVQPDPGTSVGGAARWYSAHGADPRRNVYRPGSWVPAGMAEGGPVGARVTSAERKAGGLTTSTPASRRPNKLVAGAGFANFLRRVSLAKDAPISPWATAAA